MRLISPNQLLEKVCPFTKSFSSIKHTFLSFTLIFFIGITQSYGQIVTIDYEDFESGWGIWNDGGGDCSRNANDLPFTSWSITVQDNSGVASSMYTNPIDITAYSSVDLEFYYHSINLNSSQNEDFFIEYDDGSGTWQTLKNWVVGTNFNNGTTYHPTITIDNTNYTFSANSRFRIRCDAGGNLDDVHVDNVTIRGVTSGTYCTPSGSNTSYYIDDFSTTGGSTNITNNNSGYSTNGYGDFTGQTVTQIAGQAINFSAQFSGSDTFGFSIWVDWNNDNDFYDAGEEVYTGGAANFQNSFSGSFSVPGGTASGNYRMRILADYWYSIPNPCSFYYSDDAEAEDYTLTVSVPPPCTEPTAQATSIVLTPTDTTISGSFTAASPAPDNYLVLYNTDNSTPVPTDTSTYSIGGTIGTSTVADNDNDTSFSVTGLTPSTTYYFFVYSFNSNCTGGPDYYTTSPLTGNITTSAVSYCTPSFTSSVEPITNVTFNPTPDINNTTSATVDGTPALEDFTAISTSVTQLSSYTISVQGNTAGNYTNYFTAYIDWNQNGTLNDTGEVYNIGSIANSTGVDGTTATLNITIPGSALTGNTRMRVMKNYNAYPTGPCASHSYGQAEDYTINVVSPGPCSSPTDAPTSLSLSPNDTLISGSFTAATSNPDSYLVVYSTSSTLPTPPSDTTTYAIGSQIQAGYYVGDNDNDTYFMINGLTASTTYYFFIYSMDAICSGGPLYYSTPLTGNATTLATGYCMPESVNDESDLYIEDIEFIGTLNDVQNFNNGYSSNSPVGYQDWTALPNSIQAQGQGINVHFESGVDRGHLKAWVDWNQDNSFDDSTEKVYDTGTIGTSSTTFGFTVPAAQAVGEYRIRLKFYHHDADDYSYDSSPCEDLDTSGDDTYGEIEDYTFTVIESCPAIIATKTDGDECNEQDGDVAVSLTVTGSSGTTEFRWYDAETGGSLVTTTPAVGLSATYSPTLSSTTDYYVTAYNGSCESLVRTKVTATVRETTNLTFTPNVLEPCGENDVLQVTASATSEVVYHIDEEFESGLGVFSVNNINNNGAAEDAATEWQVETSTFIPSLQVWFPAISSGFGTNQFAMATSDYGSSNITQTALELTNSVDTSNFTDLTLNFDMYFSRYLYTAAIPEYVDVEVSTNGGTSWTSVATYDDDVGYGTAFSSISLDLSAYVDETDLKIRFRYFADTWCDGVAIDNIQLFGTRPVLSSFTWDDGGLGYVDVWTDAAATTPYTGTQLSTIYITLTSSGLNQASFSFDVTANLTNSCNVTETIPVTNFTKTWNVGATDWKQSSDWMPIGVPDLTNCVVIRQPTVIANATTYDAYARNVTIKNGGGDLELQSGHNLTVQEWINIEAGGNFDIRDDANFIQLDNVAVNENSGSAEVQREVTGVGSWDYVYWSSPVAAFDVANISPSTPVYGRWRWVPSVNGNGIGNHGEWNTAAGAMTQGQGYIIRDLEGTGITDVAEFSGVLNNGIITVPISRGTYNNVNYSGNGNTATRDDDNWNLLGNPYPSSISLTEFTAGNSDIDGTLYFWRHLSTPNDAEATPFYENFGYNYAGGDYMSANSSGSTPAGFSGNIASGQGFFLLMNHSGTSTSENVTFNNTMRVDGSDNAYDNSDFVRYSTNTPEKHRIWLDLVDNNNIAYSILVGYIEGATDDVDRLYDGVELSGMDNKFYSICQNEKLAIQGLENSFDIEDTIPLGYELTQAGSYTIALSQIDGLFDTNNQDIYIEDTLTGIIHDLRVSPYTFTTDAGDFDTRLILRFNSNALGLDDIDLDSTLTITGFNQTVKVVSTLQSIDSIELFDITGRIIHKQININNLQYRVTNSQLSSGAYIVQVTLDSGHQVSKKIILN